MPARKRHYNCLLDDFSYDASADGTTAFTDSETQTVFHRDGLDQGNSHLNVVTWHYHFNAFWQLAVTSHVSCTEVELWTVALEERSMTAALFLAQNVNFCGELGVRLDGTWLDQNLATLNIVTLGAAQQHAAVLTSTTFVEQLAEHFNAGAGSFLSIAQTDNLNFFLDTDDATLNTTSHNSTATGDREHVFDRHQERLIDSTLWLWDVAIQSFHQLLDSSGAHFVVVLAVQSHQSRTDDDWSIITWEIVSAQQIAHFHLNQFQQLSVVNHVSLVQEDNDVRNAYLTGQQDVLTGLRHRTISGRANQDRAVHLSSTSDHVFYVVGVTWAVNVCVVTHGRIVLNVSGVDGDTASFLFRGAVDLVEVNLGRTENFGADTGQSSGQRGFTVVNVTNGTNVDVRLITFELFLSHRNHP
ncbi:Anti restriction protein [Pseudomonas brassicacearum]